MKVAEPGNRIRPDYNLEQMIDRIESVGELLIFNTDESPYLGTVTKVPAYVPTQHSKVVIESLLEDAPCSIMKRDVLKREADEYMYAPGIGMVRKTLLTYKLPNVFVSF